MTDYRPDIYMEDEGPSYSINRLARIFNEEWNSEFDASENLAAIAKMMKEFRELSQINSFYLKKLSKWLEKTNGDQAD